MINKIRVKNNEIQKIKEGITIDVLLKEYRIYLSIDNDNRIAQNTTSKAVTQLKLFFKYAVTFKQGVVNLTTFNSYGDYLQHLVNVEELTSSQKALRRMYARRINLENKEGYLVWLHKNAYTNVIENEKSLLKNSWAKGFEDWLGLQSKLIRKTQYGKTISNIVALYLQWLKGSEYEEISALSVNAYLRGQAHLKISTLNLYLKAIKRFAVFFEKTSEHPDRYKISKEIQSLKKFEDTVDKVNRIGLNETQINLLLREGNDKQKLIVLLGAKMGLRGSSMLNLKVKDINFTTKKMIVWIKGRNNTTTLPIPSSVLQYLQEFIQEKNLNINVTLFDYKSNAISSLSKYFSDFLYQVNLKEIEKNGDKYSISLHNLRHTFAYNSLDKFGLLTTSKLLVHSSTQITEQYYLQDKVRDILDSVYEDEY